MLHFDENMIWVKFVKSILVKCFTRDEEVIGSNIIYK